MLGCGWDGFKRNQKAVDVALEAEGVVEGVSFGAAEVAREGELVAANGASLRHRVIHQGAADSLPLPAVCSWV